jgi:hypothetical protein
MSFDYDGNCTKCGNKPHPALTHCPTCAENERNHKNKYKDTISALKAELKNCKRTIRIYEYEFEKLGRRVPVEMCDRCGEILYCDNNVWVSDDDTQILCPKCMDEEVDKRE